jgi:hypothetical protein
MRIAAGGDVATAANAQTPPRGGVIVFRNRNRDQWKNRYSTTNTIAGTPRIHAKKYLPMIQFLSDVVCCVTPECRANKRSSVR